MNNMKLNEQYEEYYQIDYLYRFMSFEQFVDLVENEKLILVNPELWEDPYESFLFTKLKTLDGFKELVSAFETLNIENIPVKMSSIFAANNTTYAQSWSILPESDALWRIYDTNKSAVRIKVKFDKFQKLKEDNKNYLSYSIIEYVNEINCINQTEQLYKDDNNFKSAKIVYPFCVKRHAFAHEMEFRLFYISMIDQLWKVFNEPAVHKLAKIIYAEDYNYSNNISEFYEYLKVINKYTDKNENIFGLNIGSPGVFIDSVIVNPFAPEWFLNTVKKYCFRNNINCEGKSQLYNFK